MNLEDNFDSKAVRINFTSENETDMEKQTKLAYKEKMADNMEVKDEAAAESVLSDFLS